MGMVVTKVDLKKELEHLYRPSTREVSVCKAQGLSVGYAEAEGLTYRANVDYASDFADARDGDPRAWAQRVLLAAQHDEAVVPYMEERRG
jgi:hypothetical protein